MTVRRLEATVGVNVWYRPESDVRGSTVSTRHFYPLALDAWMPWIPARAGMTFAYRD